MFRKLCIVFTVVVAGACAPRHLAAQAPKASLCAPADDAANGLLDYARDLAQPADADMAATAAQYDITPVPAAQIAFNTDAQVCARAARRFQQESGGRGKADAPVYVIQIGTARNRERYIVVDPAASAGEYGVAMVFDAHFKLIASFTH